MGLPGVDGRFKTSCEEMLSCVRRNRKAFMLMMDAILQDPLLDWAPKEKDKTAGQVIFHNLGHILLHQSRHGSKVYFHASCLGDQQELQIVRVWPKCHGEYSECQGRSSNKIPIISLAGYSWCTRQEGGVEFIQGPTKWLSRADHEVLPFTTGQRVCARFPGPFCSTLQRSIFRCCS